MKYIELFGDDEDDKGEFEVDELFELVGVEYVGGFLSVFGGFFEEWFERFMEEGLGFKLVGVRLFIVLMYFSLFFRVELIREFWYWRSSVWDNYKFVLFRVFFKCWKNFDLKNFFSLGFFRYRFLASIAKVVLV